MLTLFFFTLNAKQAKQNTSAGWIWPIHHFAISGLENRTHHRETFAQVFWVVIPPMVPPQDLQGLQLPNLGAAHSPVWQAGKWGPRNTGLSPCTAAGPAPAPDLWISPREKPPLSSFSRAQHTAGAQYMLAGEWDRPLEHLFLEGSGRRLRWGPRAMS